jgi:hypothetical protein
LPLFLSSAFHHSLLLLAVRGNQTQGTVVQIIVSVYVTDVPEASSSSFKVTFSCPPPEGALKEKVSPNDGCKG